MQQYISGEAKYSRKLCQQDYVTQITLSNDGKLVLNFIKSKPMFIPTTCDSEYVQRRQIL
jgi:hypothetical protein